MWTLILNIAMFYTDLSHAWPFFGRKGIPLNLPNSIQTSTYLPKPGNIFKVTSYVSTNPPPIRLKDYDENGPEKYLSRKDLLQIKHRYTTMGNFKEGNGLKDEIDTKYYIRDFLERHQFTRESVAANTTQALAMKGRVLALAMVNYNNSNNTNQIGNATTNTSSTPQQTTVPNITEAATAIRDEGSSIQTPLTSIKVGDNKVDTSSAIILNISTTNNPTLAAIYTHTAPISPATTDLIESSYNSTKGIMTLQLKAVLIKYLDKNFMSDFMKFLASRRTIFGEVKQLDLHTNYDNGADYANDEGGENFYNQVNLPRDFMFKNPDNVFGDLGSSYLPAKKLLMPFGNGPKGILKCLICQRPNDYCDKRSVCDDRKLPDITTLAIEICNTTMTSNNNELDKKKKGIIVNGNNVTGLPFQDLFGGINRIIDD